MNIFLIFPIHLFSNIENLYNKKIYIIEESRYFSDFNYHKLKIAYHRATLKSYYDYLLSKNIDVIYIDFKDVTLNFYKKLTSGKDIINMYDPNDNFLLKKIKKIIPTINVLISLNFLISKELILENIDKFCKNNNKQNLKDKKYIHKEFYKWQRIRLNILIDKNGNPEGGKWSFDEDNRKKIPSNISIPKINNKINDSTYEYIKESKEYIEKNFKNNYGSLDNFIYPVNHIESKKWLKYFLINKFNNFGIYEDAETMRDPFLFHSVLTPMMNIGLLTDNEVLEITLEYISKNKNITISSVEGFIRQIIGWRNYMYAIYLLEGEKISKMNFFNHKNKINYDIFWKAETNIDPIDNIIKKINEYGYAHHIERLMYLGNFMLICMINPLDIYKLFMEWTIDAYDWVMVPNVYCMSQYADGGMIMTKPYFSSSNYILKMSDYKKDKWGIIWDALYYNFINKHKEYLSKNYGTARQVAHWTKKKEIDKKKIIDIASKYLKNTVIKK
jgi:deoxyribodipyrimidine photolyase-related protein